MSACVVPDENSVRRSSAPMRKPRARRMTPWSKVRWVCMTPFGWPVAPEVY